MASTLLSSSANSLYNFVVRDGNGVKGLLESGISHVPDSYIQPPHERIIHVSTPQLNLPPIDLSKLHGPQHDKVVAEIAGAAATLGFFQVVNHGIPVELLEALNSAAYEFFIMPPEEKKKAARQNNVKYGTSFAPEKEKALEWKDYVSMAYTKDEDALQYWPHTCKEVALEYLKLSTKMAREILKILMENLGANVEDGKIEGLLGYKMVNMNYYPECPNPELTVGVGRHSDMGTLTILLQDEIGGLYVKLEQDIKCSNNEDACANKGDWIEIPPIPGALVINIGDALQIMSNGRYRSGEHRVRAAREQSRVSVPVFTIPNPNEKIGPLPEVVEIDGKARYKEIVFQDYMHNFFTNAHEGKNSLHFAAITM